jgi:hypothetical protein
MEKELNCHSCKHDIALSDDEWNRHRAFWRNNTNILKRSFICDSCLAVIKSPKKVEPSQESQTIIPETFITEITDIWKEYYVAYKGDVVTPQIVQTFRNKIFDLLNKHRLDKCSSCIFETAEKILPGNTKLIFPTSFKFAVIFPFRPEPISISIDGNTTYFE